MTNPNKAKGTRWESAVRDYLNERLATYAIRVYRPAQQGFRDTGDLHGLSPFVVQAKDWRDVSSALREGVAGAISQADNAGEDFGVAVVKRTRRPVGDAYAVMRLSDWADAARRLIVAERTFPHTQSGEEHTCPPTH